MSETDEEDIVPEFGESQNSLEDMDEVQGPSVTINQDSETSNQKDTIVRLEQLVKQLLEQAQPKSYTENEEELLSSNELDNGNSAMEQSKLDSIKKELHDISTEMKVSHIELKAHTDAQIAKIENNFQKIIGEFSTSHANLVGQINTSLELQRADNAEVKADNHKDSKAAIKWTVSLSVTILIGLFGVIISMYQDQANKTEQYNLLGKDIETIKYSFKHEATRRNDIDAKINRLDKETTRIGILADKHEIDTHPPAKKQKRD